jgi:SAM-dependent methyltransferase
MAMTNVQNKVHNKEMEVGTPGALGQIKWSIARKFLSTVGRTSEGIRLGYRHGFDSGSMLDYVYRNKAHGDWLIGKIIDRVYLNAVGWRGIRARRELLKGMLKTEIENNRRQGQPTRILDVAAGPGRYLQELLQEVGGTDVQVLCRDLALPGLQEGRQLAAANSLTNISYEQGDAFNPAPTDATLGGAPNVIVISGLYELFLDENAIQGSLGRLYELLADGGALYFTTQTRHPQLEFIANVLPNRNGEPWIMKCRTTGTVETWARQAGLRQIESRLEKVGLFSVTTGRK